MPLVPTTRGLCDLAMLVQSPFHQLLGSLDQHYWALLELKGDNHEYI